MSEIRPITAMDFETLMDMMVSMRAESPVLASVRVDRARTKTHLQTMWLSGVLVGVMNDFGCMFGIIGPNWYSDRTEAFEQLLYVKPEKRGTGLAVCLIKAFEEAASDAGAEVVHVGSSTGIADERTASLYEKLGYSRSGISLSKEIDV